MNEPSPWVRIGRLTFLRRMALSGTGAGALLLYPGFVLGPQLGAILLPGIPFGVRLLLSLLAVSAIAAVALALAATLHPGLLVRADGSEIRFRRHVHEAAALDRASLLADAAHNRLDLVLQLGAGGRTTRLWLRSRRRVLLDDQERAVLALAIERSTIAPPRSVHDPLGRFARYNFPGALTKDEALSLVREVPMPGDPLPLSG